MHRAHELQHALEIAGTPEIRNSQRVARAYNRVGFLHGRDGLY